MNIISKEIIQVEIISSVCGAGHGIGGFWNIQ